MNKVVKILFVLSFIFPVCLYSQQVMWQNTYNHNGEITVGRDILQTSDGGYIICGIVGSPVRIYLLKLNYAGIKEWEKIIADSTGAYLDALCIQQTSDNGFVMTGRNNNDLCILRTDSHGNLKWKKNFHKSSGEYRGKAIKITNDGGFIACGNYYSFSNEKAYVVKLDSIGNLEWDRFIGDSLIVRFGSDILQFSDSIFYITGLARININTPDYTFIIKLNGLGVETQRIIYNGLDYHWGQRIIKLNSGNIIVTGSAYYYGLFFTKIDTAGNILINKVITNGGPQFSYRSMCMNSLNQIVIAAQERYPLKLGSTFFSTAVLDTNGNLISLYRLISPQNVENNPYSIKPSSDGGYIFVGDTEYNPNGGQMRNILVAKTDSLFNTSIVINIRSETSIADGFNLFQNFPNPFNPDTQINYTIGVASFVSLKIYDLLGKEIMSLINEKQETGYHSIKFHANNLPSGIYSYSLFADNNLVSSKKMLLLK